MVRLRVVRERLKELRERFDAVRVRLEAVRVRVEDERDPLARLRVQASSRPRQYSLRSKDRSASPRLEGVG